MEIGQRELRELLDYNPETGQFTRIKALTPRAQRFVGRPCGKPNKVTGYVEIHAGGRLRYAHRLAWIHARGQIPEGAYIDHINGNRADNRLENLRIASHADNLRNCKLRVDNTSGVKGVSFDASRGQWVASVGRRHIGRFPTIEQAAAARRAAATEAFGAFAAE
jgi:hypothetical protein